MGACMAKANAFLNSSKYLLNFSGTCPDRLTSNLSSTAISPVLLCYITVLLLGSIHKQTVPLCICKCKYYSRWISVADLGLSYRATSLFIIPAWVSFAWFQPIIEVLFYLNPIHQRPDFEIRLLSLNSTLLLDLSNWNQQGSSRSKTSHPHC